jgi:hypothetical protein
MAYAGDDKAPNQSDKKAPPSEKVQAVDNALLARQLASYAQAHQDALGLVVAARMIQDQPTQTVKREKEGGGTGEAVSDPQSVEGLLAQAREHSGGWAEVVALIDETAKRGAAKGASGGPTRHVDRVSGNTTDTFGIDFEGGEEARIGVIGDGKADLDCYIYDEGGHLITSDTDLTPTCALNWNPAWTGPFLLRVKNNGSQASTYVVVTN